MSFDPNGEAENFNLKGQLIENYVPPGDVANKEDAKKMKVDIKKVFNPYFEGTEAEKSVGTNIDLPKEL